MRSSLSHIQSNTLTFRERKSSRSDTPLNSYTFESGFPVTAGALFRLAEIDATPPIDSSSPARDQLYAETGRITPIQGGSRTLLNTLKGIQEGNPEYNIDDLLGELAELGVNLRLELSKEELTQVNDNLIKQVQLYRP